MNINMNSWFMNVAFALNRGMTPLCMIPEHVITFVHQAYTLTTGNPPLRRVGRFVKLATRTVSFVLSSLVCVHVLHMTLFRRELLVSTWLAVVAMWGVVEGGCRDYQEVMLLWRLLRAVPHHELYRTATAVEIEDFDDVCAICLNSMDADPASTRYLPCKHIFHQECLRRWLEVRVCCPKCQTELGQRAETQRAADAAREQGLQ
jgi:hypothetical protein